MGTGSAASRGGRALGALVPLAVFVALALATHAIFLPQLAGRAATPFVYLGGDSLYQYAPASSLLQRSLIEDGGLGWSWSYGLGGDLLGQFSYYYSTAPFFYLQFAVQALLGTAGGDLASTLAWKLVFSMVKQVLCMELMYLLLRSEGHDRALSITGAAVYGCCPWFIDTSVAFDSWTDAMLWPPLLMMGLNRYRNTGSWVPLALAVGLSVASNFYFAYITAVLCVLAALIFSVRDRSRGDAPGLRGYLGRVVRLAGVFAVGVLVASVALLPGAAALAQADRTVTSTAVNLLPSLSTLELLPEALFGRGGAYQPDYVQCYLYPLVLIMTPLLHPRRLPPHTARKTALALAFGGLWLIPASSSAMNAFSYPTTRWCYLVVFCVAWAFPDWVEQLVAQRKATTGAVAGAAALAFAFLLTRDLRLGLFSERSGYVFDSTGRIDALIALLGVASLVVLWLYQRRYEPQREPAAGASAGAGARRTGGWRPQPAPMAGGARQAGGRADGRTWLPALFSTLILAGFVCAMPCGPYAAWSGYRDSGGMGEPMTAQQVNDLFTGGATSSAAYREVADGGGGFSRFVDDQSVEFSSVGYQRNENRTWVMGGYGVSAYNSMISRTLNQGLKYGYGVTSTIDQPSQYRGLGHRLMLEEAWGVDRKLNVTEAENLYGYAETGSNGVWATDRSTGIDLWYPLATSAEDAGNWSFAARDAAVLQTAVLGGADLAAATSAGVAEGAPDLSTVTEVALGPGAVSIANGSYADGVLTAGTGGATVRIAVPADLSGAAGEYLLSATVVRGDGQGWSFSANAERYSVMGDDAKWNYPNDTYTVCFPQRGGDLEVTVSEGTYQVSGVSLAFNSYALLDSWTLQAEAVSLQGLEMDGHHVSGTAEVPEAGILALSIPYDSGWSVEVDGKPARLLQVNGMMMGVQLDPGTHQVTFTYRNRWLAAGAVVSAATLALIGLGALLRRRRRGSQHQGVRRPRPIQ